MANKYDRIIKENFNEPVIWVLKKLMGTTSISLLPLLPKMQHTVEKEADMLLRAEPGEDGPFIAHVEWQTSNDPNMHRRMLLYHAMAYHTYKLPVKSYVIYLGQQPLSMIDEVHHTMLSFHYQIIDLYSISADEFLSSNIPGELILAILANPSGQATRADKKNKGHRRKVIREILYKLRVLLKDDEKELNRKITQLEVLGELRNIQNIIIEEEQIMAITYNLENDIRFKQGLEKGIEKGMKRVNKNKTTFVKNLLLNSDHTAQEIASFADVSVDFVLKIKKTLPSA